MTDYQEQLDCYRSEVERFLDGCFTQELPQKQLFEAMRYSLLAGGKRIRPILVMEFCRVCGGDWKQALPFAAAIEMIHTYSLIHDDLPCMDNDDYRRGRLTNHKVFGEALAVLAGDGLLTAAFETAASCPCDADIRAENVRILAEQAGELGMVGGQTLDLAWEQKDLSEEQIRTVQRLKTGALIRASCRMGVVCARGDASQVSAAERYADALGLAFQLRDDLLDVQGDASKLGKAVHMDEKKSTFVRLYGVDACIRQIREQTQLAIDAVSCLREPQILIRLADELAVRES